MENFVPPQPPNSFRIVLELNTPQYRLDTVLLAKMKSQKENLNVSNVTRGGFKKLFQEGRIQIKGQKAKPSSSVNRGITYVDLLGF